MANNHRPFVTPTERESDFRAPRACPVRQGIAVTAYTALGAGLGMVLMARPDETTPWRAVAIGALIGATIKPLHYVLQTGGRQAQGRVCPHHIPHHRESSR